MKIAFSYPNKNKFQKPSQNQTFGAGLTLKAMQEIQQADVLDISKKLAKKGISTDFKGNKVIAWCCNKTIDIFEQFNKKFKTNLSLPKGIYVEDFSKLHVDGKNAFGLCNFFPTRLVKNSDEIVPSRTIYFNNFEQNKTNLSPLKQWLYNWNNINETSDYWYARGQSGTDFFLDTFIHEFAHVAHEDNILSKCEARTFLEKVLSATGEEQIIKYHSKYGKAVSQICEYAEVSPFEAIACDFTAKVVSSLDAETLIPIKNPFVNTPYKKLPFWSKNHIPKDFEQDISLDDALRNFWNGVFV